MKEVLVWMLINISSGGYNHGNIENVAYFSDSKECMGVAKILESQSTKLRCIKARILIKE